MVRASHRRSEIRLRPRVVLGKFLREKWLEEHRHNNEYITVHLENLKRFIQKSKAASKEPL